MPTEFSDKYKPLIERGYINRDLACALTGYEKATGDTITFDEKALAAAPLGRMKSSAEGRELEPEARVLPGGERDLLHIFKRPGSKDPHIWLVPDGEFPVREFIKPDGKRQAGEDSMVGTIVIAFDRDRKITAMLRATSLDEKGLLKWEPVEGYDASDMAKKLAKHARACPTPMM